MKLCRKEVENAKVNDKILFVSFSIGTQWIKHINPKQMWWMFCCCCFFLHFHKDPSAVGCEMHVLYTPSCSKTQAHYITLHLSCQTHWTHADLGSTEVIQCISDTMPHSFGIHRCPDISKDKSIKWKKKKSVSSAAVYHFYGLFKNNINTKLSRGMRAYSGLQTEN